MSILCQHILSAVIAYLIGSVSFSKIVCLILSKVELKFLAAFDFLLDFAVSFHSLKVLSTSSAIAFFL